MTAPVLTPHEMRDRLVASYLASYQRAGIATTEAEIERMVVADLLLVDAARASGELTSTPAKPRDPGKPMRPTALAKVQAETRTRLTTSAAERRAQATPYRPQALYRNPLAISERWGAAVARINRILEGAARSSSLTEAVDQAEYPKLAREFAELYAYYLTRSKPAPTRGVDHNPFRGLSDRDASRLFMARVEAICDRSTSVLNHWWVR